MRIRPLQRAGARLFGVKMRCDDPPPKARTAGHCAVAGVESAIRLPGGIDPGMRTRVAGLD